MDKLCAALTAAIAISWTQAFAEEIDEKPVLLAHAELRCAATGFSLALDNSEDREGWGRRASTLFKQASARLMELHRREPDVDTLRIYGNLSDFYSQHPDFLAGMIASGILEDAMNEATALSPEERRAKWRIENCEIVLGLSTPE